MKDKTSLNKLPKIIGYLEKQNKATPSSIASHIKSDLRTTNKMLSTLSNPKLNLVKSKSFDTGKKTYSVYFLAEKKTKLKWR